MELEIGWHSFSSKLSLAVCNNVEGRSKQLFDTHKALTPRRSVEVAPSGQVYVRVTRFNASQVVQLPTSSHAGKIVNDTLVELSRSKSELEAQVESLTAAAKSASKLSEEVLALRDQLAVLKRQVFGVSSEQVAAEVSAMEPVTLADVPVAEDLSPAPPSKKKPALKDVNAGRKPIPPETPRVETRHSLPAGQAACPCCSGSLTAIGEEVSERARVVPAKYFAEVVRRTKYVCRDCGKHTTTSGPPMPFPGTTYGSPDFVAHAIVNKFQYGLPFYRQELMFARGGLPVSRTTLANLAIKVSEISEAIIQAFRHELHAQAHISADETTIQCLKEPGRRAQSKSYLWVYKSRSGHEHPVVIFDYQETRAGKHALEFLTIDGQAYTGGLQVDGYAGYNVVASATRHGCWAHARRKFFDATDGIPEANVEYSFAGRALDLIGRLYGVEKAARDMTPESRQQLRQQHAAPVLEELHHWLLDLRGKVVPKGLLGRAIRYTLDEWGRLTAYVGDGHVDIDNNACEREIKQVVMGRKNWLFADTPDGARANAVLYSLVRTAIANDIDPYKYLVTILTRWPRMKKATDVLSLMPWSLKDEWAAEARIEDQRAA